MGIKDVWKQVQNFFSTERNEIKRINKARFPGMGDMPFMYDRGTAFDMYSSQVRLHQNLYQRYKDYENMDDYPEIAAALDIYADEATQPDFIRKAQIWAEGDNDNVTSDINFVLHQQLEASSFLWELTRYLCKYGNNFERLFINENGVVGTQPLPVPSTRRVHDEFGELAGFIVSTQHANPDVNEKQFRSILQRREDDHFYKDFRSQARTSTMLAFEDWEVSHFRLVKKNRMSRYGYGIGEDARWAYKRLTMMEDAAVIHKLTRAPSRYAFYVDTGDLTPQQAMQHAQKVRDMFKKQKIVNPQSGELDMTYNPLSIDEDLFIPVHRERGEAVRVDTLQGAGYQSMEDVDYFRKKLGRALKIPNFAQEDRAQQRPMSFEDIRFASQIMRIQQAIITGFKKITDIHLIATGRSPNDFNYSLMMTVPSAILELARIEVLSAKSDFMSRMEQHVSIRWMLVNLFGFSEEEAVNLMVMRQEEMDMAESARTEREVHREKLMNKLRESKELNEGQLERIQGRLNHMDHQERMKNISGARGVSEQAYTSGRNDLDAEAIVSEVRKKDPELYSRLDNLRAMLQDMRATTKFKRGQYD